MAKKKAKAGTKAKVVPGYEHYPATERRELVMKTYEYEFPFAYPNVEVNRNWLGPEFHGMELNISNTVNTDPDKLAKVPADHIIVQEKHPMVRVVVIGSACTPPGYVTLEAEPTDDFRKHNELDEVMPVRFRADNLWGMHLRWDQWFKQGDSNEPLPESFVEHWPVCEGASFQCTSRNLPMAGMSCAIFEIPRSLKVTISGGSVTPGWTTGNGPEDGHYSFRLIRTTLAVPQ